MNLSDLTEQRRKYVELGKTIKDKSHEIIAGLYSDPSHFVYELLQNADDARATEVTFTLRAECVEITHNGKKLFDQDDVESIITFGVSTKKDEVNAIGKFGVGFKSVFSITNNPEIHSGDFHFRIADFIVPEEIAPLESLNPRATVFIIPFKGSNSEKHAQILARLKNLVAESLLFLRNIKRIQWDSGTESGSYQCKVQNQRATLTACSNTQEKSAEYILFKDKLTIGNSKPLTVAIAYLVDTERGNIKPVANAELFVFFPVEKETTGLKFLAHAPYKTTPSRETINFNDDENRQITAKLAELIAQSIQSIKDKGLLNVDFLTMLPLDATNEHDHALYRAAFASVKQALASKSLALLPTAKEGDFTNADGALLARGEHLAVLLDPNDCKKLFGRNLWLDTGITDHRTSELRGYIMNSLGIPVITMEGFCKKIDSGFIQAKSDEWMIRFYSALVNPTASYSTSHIYNKDILLTKPIIRLEDGTHVNPTGKSGEVQVYIPGERSSQFRTVKKAIANNESARVFLDKLGLKQPDDIAEIKEFIIPKYQGDNIAIGEDQYRKDFAKALAIWSRADEYKKREIRDILRESRFIRCRNRKNTVSFQLPHHVYFATEKLSKWFASNPAENVYFEYVGAAESTGARKFLEYLGVEYDVRINGTGNIFVNDWGNHARSVNGFNPAFYIEGLDFSLENINIGRSVFLWSLLLIYPNKLRGYIEKSQNRNGPFEPGYELTSKALRSLDKHFWLYDQDGKLIKKNRDEIMLDDLHADYQKEGDNVERLVKALGLKLDEIAAFETYTGLKAVSLEDYELLQQIKQQQEQETSDSEADWTPDTPAHDAKYIEEAFSPSMNSVDLSAQEISTKSENTVDVEKSSESVDQASSSPENRKAIGDWGEAVARQYLLKKFPPPQYEVIWLNQAGNVGKGYDFVVKEGDAEIAYYEVKAKQDEKPQLFQISGQQWNWAQHLYQEGQGAKYVILLVANAGQSNSTIKLIDNPVELWKQGKLFAEPVNIKL